MLLADLGAEVVKVESPAATTPAPGSPPVRDGVSTYYLGSTATSARWPSTSRTRTTSAAQELARRADVLVENFKPGGLARFGLDYDSVRATNPGVVYASISGFGSGPGGADLPGYDLIVQAISGLMSLTGDPDGQPYRAGISVFDVMAGLHATIGVLAALNARHETGHRASTSRSTSCPRRCPGWSTSRAPTWPVGSSRSGWATATPACSPTSRCPAPTATSSSPPATAASSASLVEVLGVPELADDPRFRGNEDRTANRDELRPLLVERLPAAPRWSGSATSPPPACLRADQHRRRRRRVRRVRGPGPGGRRGRGRGGGPVGPQPDPLLGHAARLPPAAAGPRRAR